MMSLLVKIKRMGHYRGPLPEYATGGSAAADLCAFVDEPVEVPPSGRVMVPTGIAIELPSGEYVALVFARSGLATKSGLTLLNGVGVIDSDYRGEIKVGLVNLGSEPHTIKPGDKIAQLAVMPVCRAVFQEGELSDTERGAGGFGSTGR